jgi:hypothetical protein
MNWYTYKKKSASKEVRLSKEKEAQLEALGYIQ